MPDTTMRISGSPTTRPAPTGRGRPRTRRSDGRVPAAGPGLGPLGVNDLDGPESIRMRAYATGTHVALREIDVTTNAAPRDVVWSTGTTRLYRYRASAADARHGTPLLLIYGFILKSAILDLVPGNSIVEHLLAQGFDVYLLDVAIGGHDDADLSVEDLVLDHLPGAIDAVLTTSDAEQVSILGASQGGTLAVMHAALATDDHVRNLVLISTPTEFAPANPGPLGWWTLASRSGGLVFDPVVVPRFLGNLPTGVASAMITAASSAQASGVRAVAQAIGGRRAYDAGLAAVRHLADDDVAMRTWLAVCRWVDDAAPVPGETFRRWVRDFYQRDELVTGRVHLRGRRVDLTAVRCSLLNIAGRWDHIVPPAQTAATTRLAGSPDTTSLLRDAGHIGILVGPSAMTGLWPRVTDWLASRSD